MSRKNISSQSSWEPKFGFSRAVRVNSFVSVAGTAAVDEHGNVLFPGDPYAQSIFILKRIQKALEEAGATLNDVVRTRMFVTDPSCISEVGKAHSEFFHNIRPASTLVQVKGFVSPGMLVEMEADAVIQKT